MPGDLLSRARNEAEASGHSIRLAALLRIAYLESASDPLRARLTLTHSLDECRYVPRRERQCLIEDGRIVAAAIAPEIVTAISVDRNEPARCFSTGGVLNTMVKHGHYHAAFEFVMQADPHAYPFSGLSSLLVKIDPLRRLDILRNAVRAWRCSRDQDFVWILRVFWQELPPEEALEVTCEIVDCALTSHDVPVSGAVRSMGFSSTRQLTLFQIFHVLRHLAPGLAKSLIAEHEELAAAAHRFPNGFETIRTKMDGERNSPAHLGTTCRNTSTRGLGRDFAHRAALLEPGKTSDFAAALKYAHDEYNEDTSRDRPNYAPKCRWPSTLRYRTVLYQAGIAVGPSGSIYLELIPDSDLRLLSLVEFATALAGLPQLPAVQNRQPYPPGKPLFRGGRIASIPPMPSREFPGDTLSTPDGILIRCPQCNWLPPAETRWSCHCGHVWNTFWTSGQCPACNEQSRSTQCLQCGELSAHRSWYLRA